MLDKIILLFTLFSFCFSHAQEDLSLDQLLLNSNQYTAQSLANRVFYQRSAMVADIPHFNMGINTATYPYFEQAILEMYFASNQSMYMKQNTLREKILPEYGRQKTTSSSNSKS